MDNHNYDNDGYKIIYYISEQDIYDYYLKEYRIKLTDCEIEGISKELIKNVNHEQILQDAIMHYTLNQ